MRTVVASPFEDDAAEIIELGWGPIAAFMMRDSIFMGQRVGQAFMNILRRCDAAEYGRISGSLVDPFYDDSKIPAALDLLTTK